MKTFRSGLVMLFIAAFLLGAFTIQRGGTVKGIVIPTNAAFGAYAISGADSAKTNIIDGRFELRSLKEGTYTILIQAVSPYKNTYRKDVIVREGELTDLGTIEVFKE